MTFNRFTPVAAAALMFGLVQGAPASAVELVYGSWPPAAEYLNRVALPKAFADIDKATNGAIKWKLVPGGQLADPKATFQAIQDGLMHSGLGISTYVPNVVPSLNTIYSTVVFGDDIVAATGGALETLTLNCPSCIEEFKKINTVPLSGWTSSPYQLACREPIRTLADMKGKRIRATGGNVDLVQFGGGVPVSATLVETVGLLQRGGLDCQFGVHTWLKTFGYGDFAKHVTDFPLGMSGPAVGLMLNRDAWNKFTADQKQAHLKAAAWISATQALGQFVIENENIFNELKQTKGLNVVKADAKGFAELTAKYDQAQRETNIANAKKFGVKDPGAIIDAYTKARAKWAGLSKGIGRDIDKFADAIWREIYSKADVGKL
jgi:TRAP-type C4-dicarboxylate transport system substrate-binding protein